MRYDAGGSDRSAEMVGRIGAECAAEGVTIPFDDLLIGCCALERGYGDPLGTFWECDNDGNITLRKNQ